MKTKNVSIYQISLLKYYLNILIVASLLIISFDLNLFFIDIF